MQTPFCSIIVLNYQGEKIIEATLNSLLLLNYPQDKFEIIIVDNGSYDKSKETIEQFCHPRRPPCREAGRPGIQPEITTIFLKKNLGFAAGNNTGIQKAQGKYVALLNNDCIVHIDWLRELVTVAEKDDKIFAVNPKIYLGKTNKIQNAGIKILPNGYAQDRGAVPKNNKQEYEKDIGQYEKQIEIDAVTSTASLYRKSILNRIGPLDISFFLYYEDVEISKRAKKFGYKLMYAPHALAYHTHSTSSKENSPFFIYHVERGRLLFVLYHYPLLTFLKEMLIFGAKAKGRLIIRLFTNPSSTPLNYQYIKVFFNILCLWPYLLGAKQGQLQKIKSYASSLRRQGSSLN